MSTVGLSSSLLSQIVSSPSTEKQFASDLNQLAQDLQGGNLSAAQQDYVTLSDDAQSGAASSTATTSASGITTGVLTDIASSSTSSDAFDSELNQLGTDLQNGNLSSAQSDMLSIDSTALNAASAAGTGTTTGSPTAANQAQANELISTIMQAMDVSDNSLVSSGLSELASFSSNSTGVSVLEQASQSFGSSTDSSSSTSSISQLLQSADTNNDSSTSALSLLA